MKNKKYHILLTFLLSGGILTGQLFSTPVDASARVFQQEVSQDEYQKAITKGFLGRRYGVGGNRYICNTYVESALENLSATLDASDAAFKNVHITNGQKNKKKKKKKISTPTSYDWTSFRIRFTYTKSVYDEETDSYSWDNKTTTTSIRRKNKGTKRKNLEMGDVLTYGSRGGHVALYFGKYETKKDVMKRLVELGVYKPSELRKRKDRYVNKKGRPIIREYQGGGCHWRIHATNKGLLIDNAIISKRSNGTSSFGKWHKTIPSGYQCER